MTLGKLFLAMYGVLATYFSCVMIRLMLVLAPVVCVLAGIASAEILRKASKSVRIYPKTYASYVVSTTKNFRYLFKTTENGISNF